MEKSTAEVIVKIYAILGWIGAVFSILGGFALIFGGSFLGSFGMMGGSGMFGSLFTGFAIVMGIVLLALGVFEAYASLALWQHKNWARIVLIVFSVLSLISFPVGTIIGALAIWLFGFEKTVVGLFK